MSNTKNKLAGSMMFDRRNKLIRNTLLYRGSGSAGKLILYGRIMFSEEMNIVWED